MGGVAALGVCGVCCSGCVGGLLFWVCGCVGGQKAIDTKACNALLLKER